MKHLPFFSLSFTLLLLTACASEPVAYHSKLVTEPTFTENGLEFTKVTDKSFDISYAVATASSDSIYLLVKAHNLTSTPLTFDPAMLTLKNERNERVAARDPEILTREVDRSALVATKTETEEDGKVVLDQNEAKRYLAAAKENRDYITRNFLKKTLVTPGQTVSGYVLFYAYAPAGKWTLLSKVSDTRAASNKMHFEVLK